MIVKYATYDLLNEFYGEVPTQQSVVVMDGDKIMVVAGLVDGEKGKALFMDLHPDADKNSFRLKKMFFKVVPILREMMDKSTRPVYSFPTDGVEEACFFLEKVGLRRNDNGVYQWI